MKTQQICIHKRQYNEPIAIEELPGRADLRPIGLFDGLYPEDELEREAYWDFISWVLEQDVAGLKSIPSHNSEADFWQIPFAELSRPGSAFNTVDFARQYPFEFDKGAYRMSKILEQARDLAIRFSCLTREESRRHVHQKFVSLVEREFRERALMVAEAIERGHPKHDRQKLSRELWKLNQAILACNRIWKQYADWPDGLSASSSFSDGNASVSGFLSMAQGGGYA